MSRVWGYARVMADHPIAEQEEKIAKYAADQLANHEYAGCTVDESAKRPMLEKLSITMERGDHLVFASLHSGFSTLRSFVERCDTWYQRGIAVHVLDLGGDVRAAFGVMRTLEALADWEDAVKKESKRRQRGPRGGRPSMAWGWRWEGRREKRRLVPNEEEREAIRRIVQQREHGWMFSEIARALAADRIRLRRRGTYLVWTPARCQRAHRSMREQMPDWIKESFGVSPPEAR